jgi:predicted metal-dependent enzyme (double-stranded beta helix superfamily)
MDLDRLQARGDAAVLEHGPDLVRSAIARQGAFDGIEFLPAETTYTRRLLTNSLEDELVMIAMEWPNLPGGYDLVMHGHHNRWCIDGLKEGEQIVTPYRLAPAGGDEFSLLALEPAHVRTGGVVVVDPRITDIHGVHVPSGGARSLHIYPLRAGFAEVYLPQPSGHYKMVCRRLGATMESP